MEPEKGVSWTAADSDGSRKIYFGTLKEAAEYGRLAKTVIIAPALSVYLTSIKIPAKNKQQILNAIPFALEDELASKSEELHFAVSKKDSDDNVYVAVVNKNLMRAWLSLLEETNIKPSLFIPESLLFPFYDEPTLFIENHQAILAVDKNKRFAVEIDNLPYFLMLYFKNSDKENKSLNLIDCRDKKDDEFISSLSIEYPFINIIEKKDFNEPSDIFVSNFDESIIIDLLQGEFGVKGYFDMFWRSWKPVIFTALIFIILQVGLSGIEYMRLKKEIDILDKSIIKKYLKAFPETKKIVNIKAQIQEKLTGLSKINKEKQNGFLSNLMKIGEAAGNEKAYINKIRYNNDTFLIEFISDIPEEIEKIEQSLKTKGINAEIESINSEKGKTIGTISVRK